MVNLIKSTQQDPLGKVLTCVSASRIWRAHHEGIFFCFLCFLKSQEQCFRHPRCFGVFVVYGTLKLSSLYCLVAAPVLCQTSRWVSGFSAPVQKAWQCLPGRKSSINTRWRTTLWVRQMKHSITQHPPRSPVLMGTVLYFGGAMTTASWRRQLRETLLWICTHQKKLLWPLNCVRNNKGDTM